MTLYTTISTYHMLETRLKSLVDRLEEHPNTLAIDLMSEAETSRGLNRKQPQDLYI